MEEGWVPGLMTEARGRKGALWAPSALSTPPVPCFPDAGAITPRTQTWGTRTSQGNKELTGHPVGVPTLVCMPLSHACHVAVSASMSVPTLPTLCMPPLNCSHAGRAGDRARAPKVTAEHHLQELQSQPYLLCMCPPCSEET